MTQHLAGTECGKFDHGLVVMFLDEQFTPAAISAHDLRNGLHSSEPLIEYSHTRS
jgi:hypothetical protein